MNIHFHLPYFTVTRCFAGEDIDRIKKNHQVWLPQKSYGPETLTERLQERSAKVEVLVTGWGTPPFPAEMLESMPSLSLLSHSAGSIKRLIPPEIFNRQVTVTTANDALAIGVAETTLGMIIAGLKNFIGSREWTRAGGWSELGFGSHGPVQETFRKTIGIVSASRVGRHLIRLLNNFDVQILVYDPYLTAEEAAALGVEQVSLEELAARSDVLSIHAPALPETSGMINQRILTLLRDGAIVINTARGSLMEEAALLQELKTGRLRAFLDVTDPEPPAENHPFRNLPNVVLTSHLAGAVTNGCFRQGSLVVRQIQDHFEGRIPPGVVTPQQFAIAA